MRRRAVAASATEPDGIDLTSLLDVVFIMLIFFVVTASFERETGLDVGISPNETAAESEPRNILVAIDADDRFRIDGRTIRAGALRANLEALHAEHPEFPVIVQPARSSTAQALVTVVDRARAAGIANVSVTDSAE